MQFALRSILATLATVLALAACTPARYVKEGADEARVAADLSECREIAARQAFRDQAAFENRIALHRFDHFSRHRVSRHHLGPSLGELEHRYARICMLSRGYELQAGE